MIDAGENIVTLKIREGDRDWVNAEQVRLKREEGDDLSHAEIFQRLRSVYEGCIAGTVSKEAVPCPECHTKLRALPGGTFTVVGRGAVAPTPRGYAADVMDLIQNPRNPVEKRFTDLIREIIKIRKEEKP